MYGAEKGLYFNLRIVEVRADEISVVGSKFYVVLKDSYAGIRAAHTAGMIPIMVPDLIGPTDELKSLAHIVVPTLNEAKLEIENLLSDQ